VRGDCVVALPRRGTKSASAVAFELASGREVVLGTPDSAELPRDADGVRLDYLSSPVGRGPSRLRLFAAEASEPWRTLELPDAISGVAEAPFGWYVGCRDGFLYGLERSGDLAWRWQTPGAASFRPSHPAELYFRPAPYRLASNGRSALVAWWGSLWSVGPDGTTEWGLRLQDLIPPHVSEVRLRARPSRAADAPGVPAQASLQEIKRAYREAVMQTHPDLHPEDPTATTRFRRVQEAYESLTGQTTGTGNGAAAEVIRFVVPSGATVSFLAVVEDDWLVGSGDGRLFRLNGHGRQLARLRVGSGALFCVRDSAQQVVAVCSTRSPAVRRRTSGSWTRPPPSGCPSNTPGPTTYSAATATTCSPTAPALATLGCSTNPEHWRCSCAVRGRSPRSVSPTVCSCSPREPLSASRSTASRHSRGPGSGNRPSPAATPSRPQLHEQPKHVELDTDRAGSSEVGLPSAIRTLAPRLSAAL
jgi:hypothetical protein